MVHVRTAAAHLTTAASLHIVLCRVCLPACSGPILLLFESEREMEASGVFLLDNAVVMRDGAIPRTVPDLVTSLFGR